MDTIYRRIIQNYGKYIPYSKFIILLHKGYIPQDYFEDNFVILDSEHKYTDRDISLINKILSNYPSGILLFLPDFMLIKNKEPFKKYKGIIIPVEPNLFDHLYRSYETYFFDEYLKSVLPNAKGIEEDLISYTIYKGKGWDGLNKESNEIKENIEEAMSYEKPYKDIDFYEDYKSLAKNYWKEFNK